MNKYYKNYEITCALLQCYSTCLSLIIVYKCQYDDNSACGSSVLFTVRVVLSIRNE